MQCWNLSGAKVTKNARILLHASLQHDVVSYSQLLNAPLVLSTPLCDHHGPVSSIIAFEIGGRNHRNIRFERIDPQSRVLNQYL